MGMNGGLMGINGGDWNMTGFWLSIQLGMETSSQLTNSLHHFSEG